jgi:magnesium-transporting ATPase (P-type)
MLYAYLNAASETGLVNPIDEAIRECKVPGAEGWLKVDELPYDFVRKRLSILLNKEGRHVLITKGALRQILSVCRWNGVMGPSRRSPPRFPKSNDTGASLVTRASGCSASHIGNLAAVSASHVKTKTA